MTRFSGGWSGCFLIVDSERASELVRIDIEDFLVAFEKTLRGMSASDIKDHKDAVLGKIYDGFEEECPIVFEIFNVNSLESEGTCP